MSDDLVELARFHSTVDAALARNRLADAGIIACLDGEATASWLWHYGPTISGVRLLVNSKDAERAAALLACDAAGVEDDAIDIGDASLVDDEPGAPPSSEAATRAFRASIIGLFFLPPLLSLYSTCLIVRHRLLQPPVNWMVVTALLANSLVFLCVIIIAGMIIVY